MNLAYSLFDPGRKEKEVWSMRLFNIIVGAVALAITPLGHATSINLKIFADSWSDTGNTFHLTDGSVPAATDYYNGRASNGPVWADHLAARTGGTVNDVFATGALNNAIDNFAVGGAYAGTFDFPFVGSQGILDIVVPDSSPLPGLIGQIERYKELSGPELDPSARHIFEIGGADFEIRAIVGEDEDAITNAATNAVSQIGNAIDELYEMGAREFIIFNFPDFGLFPVYQLDGLSSLVTQGSNAFNLALTDLVATLPTELPEISLTVLDLETIFNDALTDTTQFPDASAMSELAIGTSFCFDDRAVLGGGSLCGSADPDDRVFYDSGGHFSSRFHSLIADELAAAVVPVPGAIVLFSSALFGMVFSCRKIRRQVTSSPNAGVPE